MLVLPTLPPMHRGVVGILDAALLVGLLFPALHLLMFRPLLQGLAGLDRLNQGLTAEVAEHQRDVEALQEAERVAAERATQLESAVEENRLLLAAMEQAHEAIVITDVKGNIEYANPAFTRITGYPREEALGRTPSLLKSGRHSETFYQEMWATILAGRVWQGEIVNRRKDGSLYGEDMSIAPVRSESGEITHFIAMKQDNTERQRVAQDLQASEQQYRLLFESNPHPMFVYDTETLTFMAVNAQTILTYGYSREEFLGMTIKDLRPLEEVPRLLKVVMSIGKGLGHSSGWQHRKKDGRLIEVEITSDAIDFKGRPARLVLAYDTTERRLAEQEQARLRAVIENAAAEWHQTFDTMEDAVVIVDLEGQILRLNRAARDAIGGSYASALGRRLAELGPGPWARAAALAAEAVAGGQAAPCQVWDGSLGRWWDLRVIGMPATSGGRVILVARDVTHTMELQESLRRSATMAAMGSLVAGVAHEVRNPLFAISVNVDALQAIEVNPDLAEILSALRREVKRLSVLMEELIAYGKPVTAVLSEGPLEGALDLALQACAGLVSSTGVPVRSTVARGTWVLQMSRDRMAQVFENLFRNALQHAPPGSAVTVEAEGFRKHGDSWVRFRVSDQGPGFRPSDLPRVFEPFFSRRRGGTGLGLAIVQRIVEEHGGGTYALNRDEGGAVMVVELPCVER